MFTTIRNERIIMARELVLEKQPQTTQSVFESVLSPVVNRAKTLFQNIKELKEEGKGVIPEEKQKLLNLIANVSRDLEQIHPSNEDERLKVLEAQKAFGLESQTFIGILQCIPNFG